MKQASYENHYILFEDYQIVDILDPLCWKNSIEETVRELSSIHGGVKRIADNCYTLFHKIAGAKEGQFINISPNNWDKLFWIRQDFSCYFAYVIENNQKYLVGTSKDGYLWHFNIQNA